MRVSSLHCLEKNPKTFVEAAVALRGRHGSADLVVVDTRGSAPKGPPSLLDPVHRMFEPMFRRVSLEALVADTLQASTLHTTGCNQREFRPLISFVQRVESIPRCA